MKNARLWHPWLRINRVLRAMLHTRWSAEAWPQVKAEFKKALALKESDPARGVVQLIVTDAAADIVRLASYAVPACGARRSPSQSWKHTT